MVLEITAGNLVLLDHKGQGRGIARKMLEPKSEGPSLPG